MSEQNRQVLVVDDEPPARARLAALLEQLPGYQLCAQAANGEQAIQQCEQHRPDIVLMDIRMPGLDGLQAAKALAKQPEPPALIFCTAFDEHAIEAFKANAQAYLLKPVRREDLLQALDNSQRLNRAQLSQLQREDNPAASGSEATLLVKSRDREERIPVDEIRAFVADQKYVSAYIEGRELLIDESLKALEERFPREFIRVHRNALVAPKYIEALEKAPADAAESGSQQLRLRGVDIRPQVSRRLLPAVRRMMRDS